jgi:hypothetical protein
MNPKSLAENLSMCGQPIFHFEPVAIAHQSSLHHRSITLPTSCQHPANTL